jgi:hypothetical protein
MQNFGGTIVHFLESNNVWSVFYNNTDDSEDAIFSPPPTLPGVEGHDSQ